MASPRYCGNCGQGLREGARFCPSCGGVVPDRILEAQPGIPAQTGVTPAPIMAAVAPPASLADPPGPEADAEHVLGSVAQSGRPAGAGSEPVPDPGATITGLVPASRPGQDAVSGWEAVPRWEPRCGQPAVRQPARVAGLAHAGLSRRTGRSRSAAGGTRIEPGTMGHRGRRRRSGSRRRRGGCVRGALLAPQLRSGRPRFGTPRCHLLRRRQRQRPRRLRPQARRR